MDVLFSYCRISNIPTRFNFSLFYKNIWKYGTVSKKIVTNAQSGDHVISITICDFTPYICATCFRTVRIHSVWF